MTVALKKACSVQAVLGSESLGYLSRHTGAAGSQSGPEWRKAWEDKKKRWTWREEGGGKRICLSCQLGAQLSLSLGLCNLLGPSMPAQYGPFVPFLLGSVMEEENFLSEENAWDSFKI